MNITDSIKPQEQNGPNKVNLFSQIKTGELKADQKYLKDILDVIEHMKGAPINAAICIGHNWERPNINRTENGAPVFELTVNSKINALVGLLLYELGLSKKIIFSSGRTAGAQHPSEAEEMFLFIQRIATQFKLGELNSSDFILEDKSWDTDTNARFTKEIFKRENMHSAILVGISYHLNRAIPLFPQNGFNDIVINLPSERILSDLIEFMSINWEWISTRGEKNLLQLASICQGYAGMLKELDKRNRNPYRSAFRYGPLYNKVVVPTAIRLLGKERISAKAKERTEQANKGGKI